MAEPEPTTILTDTALAEIESHGLGALAFADIPLLIANVRHWKQRALEHEGHGAPTCPDPLPECRCGGTLVAGSRGSELHPTTIPPCLFSFSWGVSCDSCGEACCVSHRSEVHYVAEPAP